MSTQNTILADGGNMDSSFNGYIFSLLLLLLLPQHLTAAPGKISTNPLFLQSGVQPNLFFILDDSGSMDWEVLKSEGAEEDYSGFSNSGNMDFTPNNTAERLEHCAGYNVLAYDPNIEYTPWHGKDYSGNKFQDQDPSSAHANPYIGRTSSNACGGFINNDNGSACDLLTSWSGNNGGFYYSWVDSNNNGRFEAGECPTSAAAVPTYISSLDVVSTDPENPNSQTNYANWFSYYRKREYVMKRAVSQIIEESQVRMGLATINRRNRVRESTLMNSHRWSTGTQVEDIDDISTPVDNAAKKNKKILLDNLVAINSASGTPLRRALDHTGRYFQGNMTNSNLFGYTPSNATNSANGSSPILNATNGGQCQQNFALLFSDGYWNGGTPSNIGNTDTDGSGPYDGLSYSDSASGTLADVAMHYYEKDLMSGLDDLVPEAPLTVGKDDNPTQHLVTFTIAFGINGHLSCDPTDRDKELNEQSWPTGCSGYDSWPNPYNGYPARIDDMRHAAWNGRGLFMNASNPQDLIDKLKAAIAEIDNMTTSAAAAVSINSGHLKDGRFLYQAKFSSSRWSGRLSSIELTDDGLGDVQWEAHELLDSRDSSADPRMIITYNGNQGVNFEFPSSYYSSLASGDLSLLQADDLLHDAPHQGASLSSAQQAENIAYGVNIVKYLRGDRSNEGILFREREGRLGDIIHSSPRYVGVPNPRRYPPHLEGSSNSFMDWANGTVKDRTPMIYIGGNDGMLHAFEAETGRESFAYIPHALFSASNRQGLHWLADPLYEHLPYVDQTPTVMDVFTATPSNPSDKEWRTVLVGGLRAGGKSIFALDVTDPAGFSNSSTAVGNVLWEFSHNDLGYTFSRPAIARLNNGDWAAIFGNGYNSDPSGDGVAKLFIVNLATGALVRPPLTTAKGSITNNDCSDPASECNGLATPAVVDLNGDGTVDRVYAGDLQGNMWVFDLSNSVSSNWGSALGGGVPMPLFTAVDRNGNPQPITTQPRLAKHQTIKAQTSSPNVMLFFGTGQYLTDTDTGNKAQQSFYAIWDTNSPVSRSELLEQKYTYHSGNDVRTLDDKLINYGTNSGEHHGWYTDLSNSSGERVIVTPIIFGKLVAYTTIIPASNICGSAGESWLMVHDLFDGSRPDYIALDVNGDGNFDSSDQEAGINVSGVRSGDLQWQPSIVSGKIALPTDSETGESVKLQDVSSGSDEDDVSWTRFNF